MELAAQKRQAGKTGRGQGMLPGIVYNREMNVPVSVDMKAFDKVFRSQGTSSIIDLNIDGQSQDVLVKAVQMDKRKRIPQHVDFYAVSANQAVEVNVPITLVGTAQGVRDGGVLDVQKRDVLISILPRLIPQHIDIDVSALTIGDSLHVRDLKNALPAEAEILDDEDITVAAVVPPRAEEPVEAAPAPAGTEPEVITKGKKDEEEGEE
jgi:large subunit ribosomal protein L25